MGLLCSADVRAGEAVEMMVAVVVVVGGGGCIYLPGNNASLLGGIVSCKERRGQFVCDGRVSLVREIFFLAGCVALELSDSCNSTGYPITAVYSRVRLACHSLHRRSLSAFAADMRLQSLRIVYI